MKLVKIPDPGLGFPNMLEVLIPAECSDSAKRCWAKVLDRRLELVGNATKPEHYLEIQGLVSRSEWERDFVREVLDPSDCRGNHLLGATRMRCLHQLGLKLERRYPVLARDPFESLGHLFP